MRRQMFNRMLRETPVSTDIFGQKCLEMPAEAGVLGFHDILGRAF